MICKHFDYQNFRTQKWDKGRSGSFQTSFVKFEGQETCAFYERALSCLPVSLQEIEMHQTISEIFSLNYVQSRALAKLNVALKAENKSESDMI